MTTGVRVMWIPLRGRALRSLQHMTSYLIEILGEYKTRLTGRELRALELPAATINTVIMLYTTSVLNCLATTVTLW